jgi:hypothetical protein
MQYHSPLNVDLSPQERAKTYRQRRVNASMSHARWAARSYASVLVRKQLANYGVDALAEAGMEQGIGKTMTTYSVVPELCQYGARVCIRLAKAKLEKVQD